MKKLFLLLTLLVLPFIKSQAQVDIVEVYKSLTTLDESFKWHNIDYNGDGVLWRSYNYKDKPCLRFEFIDNEIADDITKSEFFELTNAKTYTLTFDSKCTKGMEYTVLLF